MKINWSGVRPIKTASGRVTRLSRSGFTMLRAVGLTMPFSGDVEDDCGDVVLKHELMIKQSTARSVAMYGCFVFILSFSR